MNLKKYLPNILNPSHPGVIVVLNMYKCSIKIGKTKLENLSPSDFYTSLKEITDVFYKNHKKSIAAKQTEIYQKSREQHIIKYTFSEYSIWCKNRDVCRDPIWCSELICSYKPHIESVNDAVKIGCSRCGCFHITSYSEDWISAKHLFPQNCCLSTQRY